MRDVVQRLPDSGLKYRKDKCRIPRDQVDYLGYRITTDGIEPTEEKKSALAHMPPPENDEQVRSFIGAAGYCRRFINFFFFFRCDTASTTQYREQLQIGGTEKVEL
jgi:hypothetical protein